MKIIKPLIIILTYIIIVSCGPSKIQMKHGVLNNIQDKQTPIILVYYPEPTIEVNTAAGVAGFASGIHLAPIMTNLTSFEQRQVDMLISDLFSNEKLKKNSLTYNSNLYVPPTYFVLQVFKEFLSKEKNINSISSVKKLDKYLSMNELKKMFGDVVVFEFKTTCWSINYYPVNWNKYWHMLCSQASMIDLESEEILWQAFGNNNSVSQSAKEAPTYEELFDNEAAGFKKRIMESAKANVELLISQFAEKQNSK